MDSSSVTSPPTSQPRACITCAHAKAKCVASQAPGEKCQRCNRLNKPCEPVTAQARAQQRKRRTPSTARVPKTHVQKLEQKLDGLVELLKSTQTLQVTPPASVDGRGSFDLQRQPLNFQVSDPSAVKQATINGSEPQACQGLVNLLRASQNLEVNTPYAATSPESFNHQPTLSSTGSRPATQQPPTGGSSVVSFREPFAHTHNHAYLPGPHPFPQRTSQESTSPCPSLEEANIRLTRFRDELSIFFPFVIIPKSMSAEELWKERPFLLKCIFAVSSFEPDQQRELGTAIMKDLATRMFINCERSMDLLIGVLTYAGWCFYHFWNIPQLTSLLSAMLTMVSDLGLNRQNCKHPNKSIFEDAIRATTWSTQNPMLNKNVRTSEDRRIFLGCFFLCSVASTFFRRSMFIRFTPYVEQCCQYLETNAEYPDDQRAAALVRLQVIVERIHQSPWHQKIDPPDLTTPPIFIVHSFQEELKRFRENLPMGLKQDPTILMIFHTAEASIYEVGLSKSQLSTTTIGPQSQRLEWLYACLQATKSFFDIYFSIPVLDYFSFCIASWSQLTSSLITLQLLSIFNHPDWNLELVRQTLDFRGVLDRLVGKMESVELEIGDARYDFFSRTAKRMISVRKYCDEKMAATASGPGDKDETLAVQETDMSGMEEFTDFDDGWLRDLLVPWDYSIDAVME